MIWLSIVWLSLRLFQRHVVCTMSVDIYFFIKNRYHHVKIAVGNLSFTKERLTCSVILKCFNTDYCNIQIKGKTSTFDFIFSPV